MPFYREFFNNLCYSVNDFSIAFLINHIFISYLVPYQLVNYLLIPIIYLAAHQNHLQLLAIYTVLIRLHKLVVYLHATICLANKNLV